MVYYRASKGLGYAYTCTALKAGDKVVAVARNIDRLKELKETYQEALLPLNLDVTDRAAVFSTVEAAIEHFGRLDIVVNNAGIMTLGMVEELSEFDARKLMDTNFFGALWVCQAVMPYLRSQRSGHIIQITSIGAIISGQEKDFRKEEIFFLLLKQLIEEFTDEMLSLNSEQNMQTKAICEFLEKNYRNNITLDDLCNLIGVSKYYLVHSFTKQKGISPYSYLETIRIDKAKKLLEQGVLPIDVALQTGFTDQSHFSNFFKKFIGLTPKQYMNIFKEM